MIQMQIERVRGCTRIQSEEGEGKAARTNLSRDQSDLITSKEGLARGGRGTQTLTVYVELC